MPRTPDQGLEKRILQAAQRLWHARGDKGLTLRAVAREAGTTTTTVYKRFRNKEELLVALADKVRAQIVAEITSAASVEEAYRRYLRFAERRPREYRLLTGPAWARVLGPERPRPGKDWVQAQLAVRFGGSAGDYARLYYALFLLNHGAASLLTVAPKGAARQEMEENCVAICDLLLKNPEIFQPRELKQKRRA